MEIYKLIYLLPLCEDINNVIANIWFNTFKLVTYVWKGDIILINNNPCKVISNSVSGHSKSRFGQTFHYIGIDIFTNTKHEMLIRNKLMLKYR